MLVKFPNLASRSPIMQARAFDNQCMAQAIQLAKLGRFTTRPNPNVGCVITKEQQILATGYHLRAGTGHAEVNALAKLTAQQAKGATAYVTLEPCSHTGRTGACAQALIDAQISRVVCAMQDPNPQVAGRGFEMLRAAGIEVQHGLMEQQAADLNKGFIKRMTEQRPYVTIKLAMSLDGRTAMQSGESQWITGPSARSDVQRLRASNCAIVTGIGSILQDDSSLTVRVGELGVEADKYDLSLIGQRQPLRVVLDSKGRLTPDAKVLKQPGRTLQVTSMPNAKSVSDDSLSLDNNVQGIDLHTLLEYLAEKEECNNVLVEAGAKVAGSFVSQGLFDELVVYMAPTILGSSARPLLEIDKQLMSQQQRLTLVDKRFIGDDIRLTYQPVKSAV